MWVERHREREKRGKTINIKSDTKMTRKKSRNKYRHSTNVGL